MKILITGANSGIGFLTGCVLTERNHEVTFTCKTPKEVEVVKEKLRKLGLKAKALKLDITNKKDQTIIDTLDLDVLFLHAGIGYSGLLKDIDIDLVRENFNVNFFANLEIIQNFLKNTSKPKKIVLTSSLLASHPYPYFGSYILSKTCAELMMKILKNESILSEDEFILIKPGAYHTGFNQFLVLSGEKSKVPPHIISFLNNIFLLVEEKSLNSIVEKIVIAIEKGTKLKYSAPFFQKLFLDY